MKKLIFTLSLTLLFTVASFTSCNTAAEKLDKAEEKAIKAKDDFNIAKEEYLADIENFKKETAAKIDSNKQKIAEFNVKIEYAKKDVKTYSLQQIVILEQKNSELKIKMDEYKADGKDNWESFKTAFNKDMNDLGEAFKNFTVKNE